MTCFADPSNLGGFPLLYHSHSSIFTGQARNTRFCGHSVGGFHYKGLVPYFLKREYYFVVLNKIFTATWLFWSSIAQWLSGVSKLSYLQKAVPLTLSAAKANS